MTPSNPSPAIDWVSGWGLYVHFPWCVAKCPYCDFNSHPLRGTLDATAYVTALLADFHSQRSEQNAKQPIEPFQTVFLGGGTPSLLPPDAFAQLLEGLAPWLLPTTEITMEANPGSREHWDFQGYRAAGINRLSIGAQSFNGEQLHKLGRIHEASDTQRAFNLARDAGFDNINLDLMYALPGQTTSSAMADIAQALALGPDHLSWYQLTIEPKTEFAQRPPVLPEDDSVSQIEQQGYAQLASGGFERYEISAFSKVGGEDGKQCQHNLNYWRFGDYLGIGAGAHGKRTSDQGLIRTQKYSQPRRYLEHYTHTDLASVNATEVVGEFAMNALRLVQGIDIAQLDQALGQGRLAAETLAAAQQQLSDIWKPLARKGLMQTNRFATTPLGLQHLDSVVAEFI